ncbi:hypothetical protein TNCV_450841 [Trichonephila clavipes]|nr:hypothetical protein TNCV_450841 [Trichonephila clavipes]
MRQVCCCAPSVSFSSNSQIPVLIWRCSSVTPCDVTSTHITIILESLPKPEYDTLGNSKFLAYLQQCTPTFQAADNSST